MPFAIENIILEANYFQRFALGGEMTRIVTKPLNSVTEISGIVKYRPGSSSQSVKVNDKSSLSPKSTDTKDSYFPCAIQIVHAEKFPSFIYISVRLQVYHKHTNLMAAVRLLKGAEDVPVPVGRG